MTITKVRLVKGDIDGEEVYAYQLPDGSILQPTVQVDTAGNPVEAATETTMAELKGVADAISTATASALVELEEINLKTPALVEIDRAEEEAGLNPEFVTDTNLMNVLGSQSLVDNQRVNVRNTMDRKPMVFAIFDRVGCELRIDCEGMNAVAMQVSGVFSGVISFYASIDGSDYQGINAQQLANSAANMMTFTGASAVVLNCAGLKYVLARATSWTSGTTRMTMVADTAKPNTINGLTNDISLNTSFGGTVLYKPADTDAPQQIVNPAISPTRPTSYADPKFSNYPQRYRRLRVESAGGQGVPFAQDPATNKLMVLMPETYALLEQLLMQQTLTNQLLAQAFNLPLPSGMSAETK